MSLKLRVFPACLLPKLLPRVPFSGPKSFFVQEAQRSGVCVTKMAQGRRPAFCCLSEECLLSGAGGNRWGAGTEKSGDLKGLKGRNSPPMPNKYPLAAFAALSPQSNIDQVPTARVPQVGSITRVDVVFCFISFCHVRVIEPEVGHRSSSALVLLSPPPSRGRWLQSVVDSLAQVCVAVDRYLGSLCLAVTIAEALTQLAPPRGETGLKRADKGSASYSFMHLFAVFLQLRCTKTSLPHPAANFQSLDCDSVLCD